MIVTRSAHKDRSCPPHPRAYIIKSLTNMVPVLTRILRQSTWVSAVFVLVAVSVLGQTTDPNSTFSDLSPEYDGGVANPTDGSTGNVLQQTLFAAYFWGAAHGGARATVVVSSEYPIHGSRILVPGNVDLVCSSYAPQTYTGGCQISQTDSGNNTAAGGSPLFVADFSIGVLSDHKTWCSIFDHPQRPGCTIINSSGASIRGFTLHGAGAAAGGADVGIRVAADNVHVQDTAIFGFFGGPGIQHVVGLNASYDWNYGTNVDMWWCANPSQVTPSNLQAALLKPDANLGGMDLLMIDGEASHNQYSTGCAFSKSFYVSSEYPYLASMNVGGAGNLIEDNLVQVDGIGLIAGGMEQRIRGNRVEYHSREAIRSIGNYSIFSGNYVTSGCLDPNLANLRPGSLDGGRPQYPSTPTFLRKGYIIMDPNGNLEQVLFGREGGPGGTSDAQAPDWPVQLGGTVETDELTWENIGPWSPGLAESTDSGPVPALASGLCYDVTDVGQQNTWDTTKLGEEVGVDGPSYLRGGFNIAWPGAITGNVCHVDFPDAYGNGQCWWGGDFFANGGPPNMAPNRQAVPSSGGGTAWVGDYSVVAFTDQTPRHYNNFQGMSDGQSFSVTSTAVSNVIDPWEAGGAGGSLYGHTAVRTCTDEPLVVKPGEYYDFRYDSLSGHAVTQVNCSETSGAGPVVLMSVLPGNLAFASQSEGTTSAAQAITVTNSGNSSLTLSLATTGDFAQTNTCAGNIGAGASCTIRVTFTPSTTGRITGILNITDLANGYSQTVALTGSGAQPSSALATIALSSSSPSLQVSAVSETATSNLYITPQNGFTGTVSLQCQIVSDSAIASTSPPVCTLSSPQVQIGGSNASSVTLTVSTHATTTADRGSSNSPTMSLAGLAVFGLLPLGLWRRRMFCAYLSLPLILGMVGCGYTPSSTIAVANTTTSAYHVLITATSSARKTTFSIPLEVQ
jgi:hypothetical protein